MNNQWWSNVSWFNPISIPWPSIHGIWSIGFPFWDDHAWEKKPLTITAVLAVTQHQWVPEKISAYRNIHICYICYIHIVHIYIYIEYTHTSLYGIYIYIVSYIYIKSYHVSNTRRTLGGSSAALPRHIFVFFAPPRCH